MKKKIVALLLLSAVIAGNIYGQEEETAKNRIAFSAGIIIMDLSYERVLTPNFSVLTQVSYNISIYFNRLIDVSLGNVNIHDLLLTGDSLSAAVKGRWYPFGGAFFLDLGVGYSFGYNFFSGDPNAMADMAMMVLTFGLWSMSDEFKGRSYSGEMEYLCGFFLQPGLGWNIDIGKKDGFRLPIAMGLDIRFAEVFTFFPNLKIGLSYSF